MHTLDWDTFTAADWGTFTAPEWDGFLAGAVPESATFYLPIRSTEGHYEPLGET